MTVRHVRFMIPLHSMHYTDTYDGVVHLGVLAIARIIKENTSDSILKIWLSVAV